MAEGVILHGIREFHDALKVDEAKMLEAARNIVAKGTLIIASRSKEVFKPRPGGQRVSQKTGKTYYSFVAPYQATPPVPTSRSGKLRNSLGSFYRVTKIEGGWQADVGTKVTYAPFVEFGTSRMQKEPYLATGLDHSKEDSETRPL